MPITAFSNFDDGLNAQQRNRGHFIANVDIHDARRWVPYAEGVWIQPCCFNVTSGGFSTVLKGLPGAKLGVHYHVAPVRGSKNKTQSQYPILAQSQHPILSSPFLSHNTRYY
jgi:hypothetical protein